MSETRLHGGSLSARVTRNHKRSKVLSAIQTRKPRYLVALGDESTTPRPFCATHGRPPTSVTFLPVGLLAGMTRSSAGRLARVKSLICPCGKIRLRFPSKPSRLMIEALGALSHRRFSETPRRSSPLTIATQHPTQPRARAEKTGIARPYPSILSMTSSAKPDRTISQLQRDLFRNRKN